MKNWFNIFGLAAVIFMFASCSDNNYDNTDYVWKDKNDQAFNALADSVENDPAHFEKVSVPQGPGYVYCKKIAKEGTATDKPNYTSVVRVYYQGQLVDGTVFANPWDFAPLDFKINGTSYYLNGTSYTGSDVIQGWKVALQNMTAGETWRVWIPYTLGYGTTGSGSIPGYSILVYDIKLVEILQLNPLPQNKS